MWHFQCYPPSTKANNNATQTTKSGKQKVWEPGIWGWPAMSKKNQIREPLLRLTSVPAKSSKYLTPGSLEILTPGRTYMRHRWTKAAWPPPTITNILAFVPHLFWNIFLPTSCSAAATECIHSVQHNCSWYAWTVSQNTTDNLSGCIIYTVGRERCVYTQLYTLVRKSWPVGNSENYRGFGHKSPFCPPF